MHDGSVEATVKELRIEDEKQWLWPRSLHPEHQTPIDIEEPGDDVANIEIAGVVVGGYRPRPV